VLSGAWLEESEFSPKIIHLDSPSIVIRCQLDKAPFDTFYNPIVGANIMSALFANDFSKGHVIIPYYQIAEKSFRMHCPKFGNSVCPSYFVKGT
jgi:hypothetical protein